MRISDWSSDVCSSDLQGREECGKGAQGGRQRRAIITGKSREGGPEEGPSLGTSTRVVARRHYARNYFQPSGSGRNRLRCNELGCLRGRRSRSEEHTSELQSLMRNSYAVFCLKKKTQKKNIHPTRIKT